MTKLFEVNQNILKCYYEIRQANQEAVHTQITYPGIKIQGVNDNY